MSSLIRGIILKNFKGFSDEVRINLRPITLLFGANSAGKSSVLQALQFVNEVLSGSSLDVDATRHGGAVLGLGGFKNLVHNRDETLSIEIGVLMSLGDTSMLDSDDEDEDELDYDPSPSLLQFSERLNMFMRGANEVELRLIISWSQQRKEPIVKEYQVFINQELCAKVTSSSDGRQATLKLNANHQLFMLPDQEVGSFVSELENFIILEDLFINEDVPTDIGKFSDSKSWLPYVFFDLKEHGAESAGAGFTNWLRNMDGARPRFNSIRIRTPGARQAESIQWVSQFEAFLKWLLVGPIVTLRSQLTSMRYVGPLRVVPSRGSNVTGKINAGDWADGSAAWATLEKGTPGFRTRVSNWMSDNDRLNTGYSVVLRTTQEYDTENNETVGSPRTRIALKDRAGLLHDPQDIGVGVSQILPVVVAAQDGRASLVCIEQPELHVHPAVQVGLGDLFIDGAYSLNLSFLIETHSEHLVMRIQRRLREQMVGEATEGVNHIDPNNVSFVYLGRNESGRIEVSHIGLAADGKFDASWPNGFFIERASEVLPSAMRVQLEARRKRGVKDDL